MPRLKADRNEMRRREVRAVIAAGQSRENLSDEKLADRMCRVRRTLRNKLRSPETFTLDELWSICDALRLTDVERAAILGGTRVNDVSA